MRKRWVYFFADGNLRRGPFTLEQLREFPLRAETMVWREGMPAWSTLRDVPELWAIFAERLVEMPATVEAPAPVTGDAAIGLAPPQTPFFPQNWIEPTLPDPAHALPVGKLAKCSLTAGVIGTIWWCLPGALIASLPLAVLAIVFGSLARKRARRRLAGGHTAATVGLTIGMINLVIGLGMLVLLVTVVTTENQQPPQPAPTSAPAGAK